MLEFINVVKLGAGNCYNRRGFAHKTSSVCADLKQCRADCSSGRLHFLDTQLETIRIRSQLSLCCRSIKNLRAQAGKVPSDAYFHTQRLQDFNLEFEYGWRQCRMAFSHYLHTSLDDRDRGGICFHRQISF